MNIHEWNKKLYKDQDGNFLPDKWSAEFFFKTWGIKSWPLFKDTCAYHIAPVWSTEVFYLITNILDLSDKIEFRQIKEKWAELVIYYDAPDDIRPKVDLLIKECKDKLREKGLHP